MGSYDNELFRQLIEVTNQAVAEDPARPETTEHPVSSGRMASTHRSNLYVVHVTTPGEDFYAMIVEIETVSRCAPPESVLMDRGVNVNSLPRVPWTSGLLDDPFG